MWSVMMMLMTTMPTMLMTMLSATIVAGRQAEVANNDGDENHINLPQHVNIEVDENVPALK